MNLTGSKVRRHKLLNPMGTPRIDDVLNTQTTEQPLVFKLQLKPLEDKESFKPSVQLVSREYATRYLESVGVRPSKAAMELVNRNIPLTETNIKTTLRAKGHVEDTIHISVPPVLHQYRPPVVIHPAAVLQLGIGNSVLAAEGQAATDSEEEQGDQSRSATPGLLGTTGRPGSRLGDAAGTGTGGSKPPGGTEFLDMAARYLHPFKMDLSLARQNLTAVYSAARQSPTAPAPAPGSNRASGSGRGADGSGDGGGGGGESFRTWTSGRVSGSTAGGEGRNTARSFTSQAGSPGPGGTAVGRSGSWPRSSSGRSQGAQGAQQHHPPDGGGGGTGGGGVGGSPSEVTRQEVLEELVQPLLVTPEVVLTLQGQLEAALVDWHRHQAPEALKGRLTPEEFRCTQEELSSEGTVKLLITLVNFLHEELVRGHPAFPAQLELRQNSRDGGRSNQGRVRESLLGERASLALSSGTDGGGGGGCSSNRSHSSARGSQLVPGGDINMQQMTSLQKYDLGYQAYVRQKLEQRQGERQGQGQGLGVGSGAITGGSRHDSSVGGPGAGGGAGELNLDRPQQRSPQEQHRRQTQRQVLGSTVDSQRVSFAAAPHFPSFPGSPFAEDPRPESTAQRGTASSLFGPLNLPGARPRPSSERNNRSATNTSTSIPSPTATTAPTDFALSSSTSPIPGLPPRVGKALRQSPSFALASAASTARSIHASLDADDIAALQRERLFALHIAFAARYKALRQSRSGMFFTLPILLLSMRLAVNLLFSTMYPLWTRLQEGARVLEDMDAALCALFDPHGYLERALSVLQSTPTAIEAVMRHPQRRGNERQHFADTSPLMQATLRGPASAGAKKLMQSPTNRPAGRGLLHTHLTGEQRAALFQQGLQWMQRQDPVLSQVGEPHPAGRPMSF